MGQLNPRRALELLALHVSSYGTKVLLGNAAADQTSFGQSMFESIFSYSTLHLTDLHKCFFVLKPAINLPVFPICCDRGICTCRVDKFFQTSDLILLIVIVGRSLHSFGL